MVRPQQGPELSITESVWNYMKGLKINEICNKLSMMTNTVPENTLNIQCTEDKC